jgi:hypothetical protein
VHDRAVKLVEIAKLFEGGGDRRVRELCGVWLGALGGADVL